MKILLLLLIPLTALALDPMQPVAQEVDGELRLYKKRIPLKWNGMTNYRKAGDAQWSADGWVQAETVTVLETNVIDRTAYVDEVDEITGETNNVPVDAVYWKEIEFVGHVYAAGLKVKPDATLEEVVGEAKKDFAGRKTKLAIERDASGRGNSSRQAEINEGVEESMELRLEAFMLGYDLFDPEFGQPTKTVIERRTVIQKKD